MRTLILTASDLQALVRHVGIDDLMSELIERLTVAFAEYDPVDTQIPNRTGFYYDDPATGLIEWMPLLQRIDERSGQVLMKMVGYHPTNPSSRQLPTILSTFSTFDTATGHMISLVDGTFLTALRTGAASAVASRLLGRPESQVLGLVGCGAQAVTQLHAISQVFQLNQVLIHDADAAVEASFSHRVAGLMPPAAQLRSVPVETLVAESDILSVATAVEVGEGPVFHSQATKPWIHINAVGSDLPGKIEVPIELLRTSFICADNPEQACREGECQQLGLDQPATGLAEVARSHETFRKYQQQRTVFDSTGWALEDQVIMELVLEWAGRHGFGTQMVVESIPVDPWNPYDFLVPAARE